MSPSLSFEGNFDVCRIVQRIDGELPDIARGVIERHLDMNDDANQGFLRHPDGREQHQTEWHQWGIITHTRVFLRHFLEDVPQLLQEWDLWHPVQLRLSESVDGVSRWDLLKVAVLLHDIGKFGARTTGKERFHFAHHESLSGTIIREDLHLEKYGLSARQSEYVARTGEDHFVLGLLRKRAREKGMYDMSFINTPAFGQVCADIKLQHPDDYIEIGVLFLGDSLAKADPEKGPDRAVSQYWINVAAARRYLGIVLQGEDVC